MLMLHVHTTTGASTTTLINSKKAAT